VNNTLKLDGTVLMQIGKTGSTLSASTVGGVTTVTFGGTLSVTNAGPDSLVAGDTFRLFNAMTYAGSWTRVNLPVLGNRSWDISRLYVDGTIKVRALSSAESWRYAEFGVITNAGNAADAADPDRDGIPNLLEYAFGSDPSVAESASAQPTTSVSGNNLVISYYQATGATDVTFIVEQSVDMLNWSTVTAPPLVIPAGPGLNLIQVAVPLAGRPSLMLRVRVTAK
jgi:hypothetical protein